ncbi:MAG: hypothetical protein PHT97_03210 [Methanoculleus sp.]|uniref:hypothetical protein n=2 Tax=Methanoculleus TaxID=45989 RepID=UPI0025EE0923|nr:MULTISPECIES: hypothetical protein [unclassified Methanoculleus]MCK9317495.1 hypothetical protein [Methanoculleus sp.]MDD2252953.1 hypothetical protein [Methanoculleus sp.]MDD3215928.1 hypothetical protein [Methanoculleus sp.]MDD4313678.1 hypothetical protein [Methanoculleus sp.]MDD4470149.1 hypothetical protein [Methanoculleus sp.]
MQRRLILLFVLLAAAAVAGGCTAPEDTPGAPTPPPAPAPAEAQIVGAGLPAPTPAAPARADTVPRSVGFVDPRTYHIPAPTPAITMVGQPDDLRVSERLVGYATASSDRPPGVLATETYHIPFPYWAVNVTAVPMNEHAWLAIEIYEKGDPNRVVHAVRYSRQDFPYSEGKFGEKKEGFTILEGYRDYYFITRSGALKSLEISVLVPEKYLV